MGNVASLGTPICSVMVPTGGGSLSLETIRDGVMPLAGSADYSLQYDTYNAVVQPTGYFGYTWASPKTIRSVTFQNGGTFIDGGWFTTITVQALNASVWTDVSGLTVTPTYPTNGSGQSFAQYVMGFTPIACDGIRVFGTPGGISGFISCGELQAWDNAANGGRLGNRQPPSTRLRWLTGSRNLRG